MRSIELPMPQPHHIINKCKQYTKILKFDEVASRIVVELAAILEANKQTVGVYLLLCTHGFGIVKCLQHDLFFIFLITLKHDF